jgi:hypothetical protein
MPSNLRRWFLACVLVAATAAQTLGVLHAVAHDAPGRLHGPGASAPAHADAHGHDLHALLAPGEDEAHCLALDQLGHAAATGVTALPLPALAPVFTATVRPLAANLPLARAYDARAPPA